MKRVLILSVVFCCLLSTVVVAEGPFASMSLEESLNKAKAQKKLVFVDFYASWCMPCKMMDATTYKDPKVVDFLKQQVIALKIDAEKQVKLAGKYHVNGFPTLVFLKPDGTIAEIVSTFLDAESFLQLAKDAIAGRDMLTRFKQGLSKSPDDPILHALTANALVSRGQHKQAIDHCMAIVKQTGLDLVGAEVVSLAAAQILQLAHVDPQAEMTLNKLHQSAGSAVLAQNAGNAQIALFAAVHAMNSRLPEILAVYDKLLAAKAKPAYLQRVTALWRGMLAAGNREQDIIKHMNVLEVADRLLAVLPAKDASSASPSMFDPAYIARQQVLGMVFEYYRLLTALEHHADAAALADKLLKVEESAAVYNVLAWTAYETGKVTDAHLVFARKAYKLADKKDPAVADTLARVLHRLGKKDEAVTLLREKLKSIPSGPERDMLERCLADIS
ncbi:MAG: thioredoxin family protein [Phycisphaerae bacterium]|nr:thioredoxin family protein [Phycisphaerae bacterium]